ncbi:AMP-binding protein [Frankia sp. CNm7]|uniref:AMP-binding protein n=1 Tax=Frankia nepalensis TaxID=1836974 RepID=A0A937URS5_9ACTN|nr:AMP-binding protein [Frankia nepalensis]MBL7499086.1 AMP-binding protein [Frankia nepalensis]MBL7511432.1 AMP-binding protein [Frankia nepalensis]MBL7517053.1 AMP-binding protein [Frankia nepalensis]MBL7629535.1 AMP-binding protein [Frankia nepalensis]
MSGVSPDEAADLYRGAFLPDLLIAALRRHPDRPAIHLDGGTLTGAQLSARISRYAQVYTASGVRPGSGVAMLSTNRPEVLYAMGAYMVAGARNTSLHPLGSLDDHAYVLADAEIETLVFDPSFAERAAQLAERVPTLKRLLSFGPCEVGEDLAALAEGYEPRPLVAPRLDAEGIAAVAYTGGTTGQPKGVMATYRGSATMTQILLTEWQWPTDLRHLVCTPLSHAGAPFIVPVLLQGGSVVVLPKFDAGQVLDAIERHRITSIFLVPAMIYAILDHPRFDQTDLSSLETVFYGASAMSPTRLRDAIRRIGPVFFQFYGQTEAPQTVLVLRKEEHDPDDPARLASCGRPVPWLKVALLDDQGRQVPPGEPGEICVRGPLVMKGYWNKPEQTAEALAGGWLHTGDIARQDEHGFYTIVDRKKDMIVSGGFNVFPREIEDALSAHPAVAAAAAVGVPDEKWGEAVKAVVVLRAGTPASPEQLAAELTALVKERKGPHHAPKSVEFVDALPLTAVGKPDKKALRARYWTGAARQVG